MHVVLDLDLDFFVDPIALRRHGSRRTNKKTYKPSPPPQVEQFLGNNCGLHKDNKIPGRQVTNHDEVFFVWKEWIRKGVLNAPFTVVHIDAHADLGCGDQGWIYLSTKLLKLPVNERDNPKTGDLALNQGNYLLFALANRWVDKLVHVYPDGKDRYLQRPLYDLEARFFRGDSLTSNELQLKTYEETLPEVVPSSKQLEPVVPFTRVGASTFRLITMLGAATHMTVAHSPGYTPVTADPLLPLITNYFKHA